MGFLSLNDRATCEIEKSDERQLGEKEKKVDSNKIRFWKAFIISLNQKTMEDKSNCVNRYQG